MTDLEALQLAIETMRTEAYLAEPMARDWRNYGSGLLFNQTESRMAAERADRLNEAARILETLKFRLLPTDETE
jgi:hypothetical protein